jgi:hypothetical protein
MRGACAAGKQLSTIFGWCLCLGQGLIGCPHGLEHIFDPATGQPVRRPPGGHSAEHVAGQPASQSAGLPAGRPDRLAALAAAVEELASQDLDGPAEPVLVEAAHRLDPPRLRRVIGHLVQVADPEGPSHGRPPAPTPGAGVHPGGHGRPGGAAGAGGRPDRGGRPGALARPSSAADTCSGGQRHADALPELARRNLEGGRLPQTGGVGSQLLVTVELASLLDPHGSLGGEAGWAGPLAPEGCRRLACDGVVTRVVVSRHPTSPHQPGGHGNHGTSGDHGPGPDGHDHPAQHPDGQEGEGLAGRLQAAMALLPPILGGAPSQPLDLGRTTRVVTPGQHHALAVRDGGCVVPTVPGPWLAGRPSIGGIGWTAAPPTWPIWCCCAGPSIGRSTRAAGNSPANPTVGPPLPSLSDPADDTPTATDDTPPPLEPTEKGAFPLLTVPGECMGPNIPSHRARQADGARTSRSTNPGECMGPDPLELCLANQTASMARQQPPVAPAQPLPRRPHSSRRLKG